MTSIANFSHFPKHSIDLTIFEAPLLPQINLHSKRMQCFFTNCSMEFMMCEFFWRCISLMSISCKFYCPHIISGSYMRNKWCDGAIHALCDRTLLYCVCKIQNMDTTFVQRPYYFEFRRPMGFCLLDIAAARKWMFIYLARKCI